ncbi:DUF192 domain-containing protein [archaeon]|nr:DUF192 domain-containing protein [archaeon]
MLVNEKGIVLAGKARHAESFWQKFLGLMREKNKAFNYALVFHLQKESWLEASIHSLFMRFAIDVLWLDENKKIVCLLEGFKPWQLNATPERKARYIVELKAGTIKGKRIMIGQKLKWN